MHRHCNNLASSVPSHSSCVYASVRKGYQSGKFEGSFQISRSRLAVVAILIELSSYIVFCPPVSTPSTTGTVLNYLCGHLLWYVMLSQNKLATGYIGTSDVSKPYLWTVSNG